MAGDKWRRITRIAEFLIRTKKISWALKLRAALSKASRENPNIDRYYVVFYDLVSALILRMPVKLGALSAAAKIY